MAEYVDVVGGSNRKFVIAADNVAARKDDGTLVDLVVDGVAVGGGGTSYDDTAIKARTTVLETNANRSLPAVALSRYASVWGDSRTNQNWSSSTNPVIRAPLARSWLWWAEALSYGRVRMTQKYNFGVSGDSISQVLARMNGNVANDNGVLPNNVPAGPAVLLIGTNSINAGLDLTTAMTQVNSCIDWLQARNHKVFVIAEWPRGIGTVEGTTGLLTAANQKLMLAYHKELLKLQATRRGVSVVNPWGRMADPTSALVQPLPGMIATDGLHNSPGNAYVTGKLLADAFKASGLPRTCYGTATIDLYSTTNPSGCLNKNPTFLLGTGGTLSSGTQTGPIPQDYAMTVPAGITATTSFVSVADNDGVVRPAFRVVLSGTATGAASSVMLRQSGLYNAANVTAGDVLEGAVEYRVLTGFTNLAACSNSITDGTAPTASYGGLVLTGDPSIPANARETFQALAQTNEFILGTGVTALNYEVRLYLAEAIATDITVDFFSASFRKRQYAGA